ncbi:rint-1 family [Lecanosticta acicola]|uniref:Rint-1 family n=1 Tax=Lecanosticta acicola TaxID=111012 RepID=A0AAI8YX57_9PEZI|nr:rint-1 family [Lecanosticta acicola]
MDTRVQDYVDDKLQSSADLESLDSLLENVKSQQELLRKQLEDARRDYAEVQESANVHTESVQRKALAFQQEQEDIDRRLLIVTQSETSDEAVQKFEESMGRLRKLDVAAGYVELLKEVDALKTECVSRLGEDDDAALEPYNRLQHLVASLKPLQDAAEGAAPHLLDHIVANVQELRRNIQTAFAENLEKTLRKMNWPKSRDKIPLSFEKEWTTNFGRLLDLQKQELEDREHDHSRSPEEDPVPLLPFEVLIHPLEQRFTYHFSGNKPTNRLDKPEYFLNHVLDLISDYSDWIQDNSQPVLLRHFRRSDIAFTPAYIDSTCAFITALVPMVKNKLNTVAGQLSNQPALLSHLVEEVIKFDTSLQDMYGYSPSSPSIPWRGLSYFLLDSRGYFDQWLAGEQNFALKRYHSIIESPESAELDFDAFGSETTKPSKAAICVNDLLETITERYRNLSSFSQKVKFLIKIQIEIFDQYYKRLSGGLEAYQTATTTIGRRVQGLSKEDLAKLEGVNGLDYLCRIFGSAEYLERAMRDWSYDVFFLELWAELDYRSKNKDTISGKLDFHDVQQKTSSALGAENDGGLEGALFDETAGNYHRIRDQSEAALNATLKYDFQQALRPYGSIRTWASLSSSTAGASVSAELDPTLRLLTEYFGFLRKALGKAPLRRISRAVCHVIGDYVWDQVLQRSSFSTAGATQLTTDIRAICSNLDRYIGKGQAQMGMRKLLESVTLLSLPVRGEIQRVQAGSEEDDGSAWEETNGDGDEGEQEGKDMSLFQVERLVFMDNESARHALEQLGLETLSEGDARAILGRRVEISS